MANLIASATHIAGRNKRYVVWFYLMNLLLALIGSVAFSANAHGILDHSLYADQLLHGFNLGAFIELLARPEFGPLSTSAIPAAMLAFVFFFLTMVFLPGVFLGYASDHRISRDEFYRTCGHNVWRFVRIFFFFLLIAGPTAAILFGIQKGLLKLADTSTYEKAYFYTHVACMIVIFIILTAIRAWFDLAESDVVVSDRSAVRKSIASGFRTTRRNGGRLLGSYVVIGVVAGITLFVGLALWEMIVPPGSVLGAFIVSQAILLLLLASRFWQRAAAVSLYLQQQAEVPLLEATPVRAPVTEVPVAPQVSGT